MARINELTADLSIIGKLPDYPIADGLTPQEFRDKFDEAVKIIQEYLNGTVVPAVNDIAPTEGGYLDLTGGTMQGDINMAGNRLTNIPVPQSDTDAVPSSYVVPKTGGAMTGALAMSGYRVTGLGAPVDAGDAVNKSYVDSTLFSGIVQLSASRWSGTTPPYIQRVTMEGVLPSDHPHYGPIFSGSLTNMLAQQEAFACISDMSSQADTLVFRCFEEKPTMAVTVQVEINRTGIASEEAVAAMLTLEEGDDGAVQAEIEGTSYTVTNATVNESPTGTTYDFTVL